MTDEVFRHTYGAAIRIYGAEPELAEELVNFLVTGQTKDGTTLEDLEARAKAAGAWVDEGVGK